VSGVRVIHPGALATVQDLGREGFGHLGVSPSGAADPLSLRVGNRLVGNQDGAAAIEMTLTGATLAFEAHARIALTGAAMTGTIERDGRPVRDLPLWTAVEVGIGDTVRTGPARRGVRAYLCVAGGLKVAGFLGSASTHVASGLGGHGGRPLRAGDAIEFGETPARATARRLRPSGVEFLGAVLERRNLRAVTGAQAPRFDSRSCALFWESEFVVTDRADRMGIRLDGPQITSIDGGSMQTEGTMWGAVQIPGSGRPIVLGVDHPTTGGYPVLACVATVDLPALGQLGPRDSVRFERIDVDAARELYRQSERQIDLELPRP